MSLVDIGEDIVTGAISVPVSEGRLALTDLVYQGCFRVPQYPIRYDWAAKEGLCYNAANNSLFLSSHTDFHGCGEITIPTPVLGASTISALPIATEIQSIHDPSEGSWTLLAYGAGINLGGLLVHAGKLIFTCYRFYCGDGSQPFSHWSRNPNLSVAGTYVGPVPLLVTDAVGTSGIHAGHVSGYMADVPSAWQTAFGGPCLTGNCGLSIVSRTSMGPAVFAFDPAKIGVVSPVPTTPLVYYSEAHPTLGVYTPGPGDPDPNPYFNGTMQMGGICFPVGSSSVLFWGMIGIGNHDYGECTADPSLDGLPVPGTGGEVHYVYDPVFAPSKGDSAYPYAAQIWAYDAAHLADVASGAKMGWEVVPYALWAPTHDFPSWHPRWMGVAYDPATQRIFAGEAFGDGDSPLIHVYHVNVAATHTLTVVNGSGSGPYTAGTVVTITANAAPSGRVFSAWIGDAVAAVGASTTTITIGSAAATVTATYVAINASGLPVVPGAFGFGMATRAAYGSTTPTVLRVTNLNDSGTGSLRSAMQATGPRVVLFDISGTISLSVEIIVTDPYLTVAGQSAPSPGITVKNYGLIVSTHDVLIQHIRVRPGGNTCNTGIESYQTGNPYNIVFDHLSVSWSQSKNYVFTNSAANMNVTVWRNICSEPTYAAPGTGSCPSGGFGYAYGLLFRNNAKYCAVLETVFAHNSERNPDSSGNAITYSANNVIYNWLTLATFFEDPDGAGPPLYATHVSNYYKTGPSTTASNYLYGSRGLATGCQVYITDTTVNYTGTAPIGFTVIAGEGIDPTAGVVTPPVTVPGYTPAASAGILTSVLANAGARPTDRDSVDTRVIGEVNARTGAIITTQADVGGWPTLAVNNRVLALPANPHTVLASGYTNLEVWLHGLAAQVEP